MTGESATYELFVDWDNDGDFLDAGEDCSADFMRCSIQRGFASPLARIATVGRASFTLKNVNRQYSPELHANMRPGRPVQFDMTYGGSTETLFRGYIDVIAPTSGLYEERQVILTCVDKMSLIDGVKAKMYLILNTTADDIIQAVTDALLLVATNYEVGINLFATSADRWTHDPVGTFGKIEPDYLQEGDAAGKILDAATADWGRFFIARDGIPTFYNRHHEGEETTTRLTLTTPIALGYQMTMGEIYNIVDVQCHPRRVASGGPETLWEMETGQPPKVEAGATLTMDCKFRDPLNSAITIGGVDVLTPVANTDYTATSDEAGDGDDKTGNVAIVGTFYGDRGVLAITNNDANPVYLQTLKIRGTAIRAESAWTATREDATSKATYGGRQLTISAILLSRPHQAERLAEHLVDVYKDPRPEIRGVGFAANTSPTLMAAARDLELLDRIALTEGQTGLSTDLGFVYNLTHQISGPVGAGHVVLMDVETAYDAGTPFRLETAPPGGGSALNSGHVLWY